MEDDMLIRTLISIGLMASWAAIVFASNSQIDKSPPVQDGRPRALPATQPAPANLPETPITDNSFVFVEERDR
jgi:hypothetical protein